MTLQTSGAITMAQINSEFGRGNNLNSYRNTLWYKDDSSSGYFSSGAISMSEFYGTRLTSPVPPWQVFATSGINGQTYYDTPVAGPGTGATSLSLYVQNDGGITIYRGNFGPIGTGWGSPLTPTIGGNYNVAFSQTFNDYVDPGNVSTTSNLGFNTYGNLGNDKYVTVSAAQYAMLNVTISFTITDLYGTPVHSTTVTLVADSR